MEGKGENAQHPTVNPLAGMPSLHRHMDPHPSPNGSHLLAAVREEGLEGLWQTADEGAQSYTAFA